MPVLSSSLFVSIGLVLCWSSGFIGTQMAADSRLESLALFCWRFILAASLCLMLLLARRRRPTREPGAVALELAAGSLNVGGFLLGVVLAIDLGVSAGVTALVTALQPLLAALVMGLLHGERIGAVGWLGSLLAAAGVSVAVGGDMQGLGAAPWWAYLLPVLSAASLTAGSLLSTYRPARLGLIERLMWQLLAAAALFALASALRTGHAPALPRFEPDIWRAIAFLVVLSSFGGYGFYIACLRQRGVTYTAVMFYLTPPCTMLWAALQFGDGVDTAGWIGGGLAALGVMLALRVVGQRREDAGPGASADAAAG